MRSLVCVPSSLDGWWLRTSGLAEHYVVIACAKPRVLSHRPSKDIGTQLRVAGFAMGRKNGFKRRYLRERRLFSGSLENLKKKLWT